MGGVLVHEWLSRVGGSERVFDAMVEAFPDADLLTLWNDDPVRRYPGRPVRESWMARTPLRRSKALALPFMPLTWRRRAGHYDWALVSSHAFAHHVTFRDAPADFRKYVYVHTPARYVWTPDLDARGQGLVPKLASPPLRSLDRRRAQEITEIAANSEYVRARIRATWGRDARVIHPPCDVERISTVSDWKSYLTDAEADAFGKLPDHFILGASRFIPYKRLDLVIQVGSASGVPVVLAGSGPEEGRLRKVAAEATVPVHFVTEPSDAVLFSLFRAAAAYVFPAVEDFGIMPVEAMAAGTPVVVGPHGGAVESVVDGQSGAVADELTAASFSAALDRCADISRAACVTRAANFGRARFVGELQDWLGGAASSRAEVGR